ncbi:hypothetical protein GCM10009639_08750 [Kitasatospora putterlickiae]|uniref:Uncharacterized protein n=1 Tax=Kitasatospora putterlickiae TaxID=221725 RepID=A0ABN1XNJ5_9ACTN
MNPEELRHQLPVVADLAGPAHLATETLVREVRRRRRTRYAVMGTAAVVAVVVTLFGAARWHDDPTRPVGAAGSPTTGPSGTPSARATGGYVCGERLDLPGETSSRDGLGLAVRSVRGADSATGPRVEVTISADRRLTAVSTPPQYIEVLYLRDGVVVGGGPMLNRPGDVDTPQGVDMVGHPLDLAPGQPVTQQLGPRDQLCPSWDWPRVWAAPGDFEVVALLPQPVETPATRPATVEPRLLVARAPFPR